MYWMPIAVHRVNRFIFCHWKIGEDLLLSHRKVRTSCRVTDRWGPPAEPRIGEDLLLLIILRVLVLLFLLLLVRLLLLLLSFLLVFLLLLLLLLLLLILVIILLLVLRLVLFLLALVLVLLLLLLLVLVLLLLLLLVLVLLILLLLLVLVLLLLLVLVLILLPLLVLILLLLLGVRVGVLSNSPDLDPHLSLRIRAAMFNANPCGSGYEILFVIFFSSLTFYSYFFKNHLFFLCLFLPSFRIVSFANKNCQTIFSFWQTILNNMKMFSFQRCFLFVSSNLIQIIVQAVLKVLLKLSITVVIVWIC